MLDGFGDFTNVDVQAIRVYRPACDEHIEVRSQYVDALVDLHRKAEHDSPYGDSVGTVALFTRPTGCWRHERCCPPAGGHLLRLLRQPR